MSRHCAICRWGVTGQESLLCMYTSFPSYISTHNISLPPLKKVVNSNLVLISKSTSTMYILTMLLQVKEFLGKDNWRFISTWGGSKPIYTSKQNIFQIHFVLKTLFTVVTIACPHTELTHQIPRYRKQSPPPHTLWSVCKHGNTASPYAMKNTCTSLARCV